METGKDIPQGLPQLIDVKELAAVEAILNLKYAEHLEGQRAGKKTHKRFSIEAYQDVSYGWLRVLLKDEDEYFYYPVELGFSLRDEDHVRHGKERTVQEQVFLLLEYVDAYFEEFFMEESTYLPIDWTAFEYEGITFKLRGQIYNRYLEKLADSYLG